MTRARAPRGRWIAAIGILALATLLAACGQTTTPSNNDANAGVKATAAPTALTGTPTATTIPLPYTFPKQWLPAPDSNDLPAAIGSVAFAPSTPQTGYACAASASATTADDSSSTPPAVVATNDGGQSWRTVSGSSSHAKSFCRLFVDQNDGSDIFVTAGSMNNQATTSAPLFRSRDGGASWQFIRVPSLNTGTSTSVVSVAVVQSRLIIVLAMNGEGSVPNPLYASDDGGASWQPINVNTNGQNLQIGGQLWISSATLIVTGMPPCQSACGYALPAGSERMGGHPLSQPLSSQPPTPNYYFKSSDGGRSWTPLTTPASNLSNLAIARSADGARTYLVGTAHTDLGQGTGVNTAFYSVNVGATWTHLPTLAGVEHGYPDPGSLGNSGMLVLPDGSVISTAVHTVGTTYMGDAGAFLLRPSDAAPTWQPLIERTDGNDWQAVPTATGVRIWLIQMPPTPPDPTTPPPAGGHLVYFDLP